MNTEPDLELLAITEEEKYLKNFKSVYYQMNAKPDSITKIFTKDILVEIEDIYNLNDMITEKFKSHYDDAGFMIVANVNFKDKKSLYFNSWDLFENHKWTENKELNSITLKWEFNAKLPRYEIPQKHTLVVKISDSMRPEEILSIIFAGGIEEAGEIDKGVFPVVASVDFIDSILGDELLEIVAKWIEGVKEAGTSNSKLMELAKKHKRKLAYMVNYLGVFIILFCGFFYITRYVETLNIDTLGMMEIKDFVYLLRMLFISSIIFITVKKIFDLIAQNLFDSLRNYGEGFLFSITRGDKRKQEKLITEKSKTKYKIIVNFVTSFILDLICAIIIGIIIE